MGYVIAIANQKGGVGKTTAALNLGASLAAAEKRVLAIDMDPQGNLSSGLGYPRRNVTGKHIYDVLIDNSPISETIRPTELSHLELAPTQRDLVAAEIELVAATRRHCKLKEALSPVLKSYEYILIDCPPSLGLLTLNSLVAANSVLVPLQCEYYALEGLGNLMATIERIKRSFNPRLAIEGILLSMYDGRTVLTRQIADEARQYFRKQVFETVIPRNIRLGEAPSFGKPILLYDIEAAGCRAFLALAQELLTRREKRYRLQDEDWEHPRPGGPVMRRDSQT